MAKLIWWALVPAATTLLSSACSVPESSSDLQPEGPPYVRQFFVEEVVATRPATLAFGWHPAVANARDGENGVDRTHPVTRAALADQEMRIVFDELLLGNNLEEIECRDAARTFSRVPLGTTPEDIANCAVADDQLAGFCKGEHATCLDGNGRPMGVRDDDEDGAADNTRMIAGVVTLTCGGVNVPVDVESTFWQPSGNQLVPAEQEPAKSLGPALVIVPEGATLPSNVDCTLALAPEVVDKDFIRPCTPTNGVEDTDNIGDCTPGELSALSFHTETMALTDSAPADGATAVPLSLRTTTLRFNAAPDAASLTAADVVVMEGATRRTDVTLTVRGNELDVVLAAAPAANAHISVAVTNLKDKFGMVVAPLTVSYTTAP